MAETWLAKLKALEAHVAVLQGTRAHVDTWRKVRKELEQIVPRPKGDLKSPPSVAEVLDQVETTSTADKASPWRILKNKPDCLISKPRTGYCLSPASYSRRFSQQSSVCNFRAADGDGLAISPARSLLDCLLPIEPTSAFAFLSFDCPEWGASLLFPSISPSWRGSRGTAPMTVCRGRLAVIALLGDSAVTF